MADKFEYQKKYDVNVCKQETSLLGSFYSLSKEFYMSGCDNNATTEVDVMWTNQHGTGPMTGDIVETQVILQYMCQPYPTGQVNDINKDFELYTIRNGEIRIPQIFRRDVREASQILKNRGMHEPKEYYNTYARRERNKGEFMAILINLKINSYWGFF